jgi:ABC-2 type transport system ATP-binding protein
MNTVVVEDVTKRFHLRHTRSLKETVVWMARRRDLGNEFCALDGVSIEIEDGESVGLLGLNGSGKSTLLKLISGVMRPDAGKVRVAGRVAGLIEVGAGLHPDLTGRENVFLNGSILGMTRSQIESAFDDIVEFSGIERFLDTEVKFYSSGMFLRLAFAVAVHTDPDVFLVDEILAVGDEPFQQKCLTRIEELKAEKKTLVIVSHNLELLVRLCDRGVLLQQGVLNFDGAIDAAVKRLRQLT